MRATLIVLSILTACTDDGLQPVGNSDTFADTEEPDADSAAEDSEPACEFTADVPEYIDCTDEVQTSTSFLGSDGGCGLGAVLEIGEEHTVDVFFHDRCGTPEIAITAEDGSCALGSVGFERTLWPGRWLVSVSGGIGLVTVHCR